MTIEDIERMQSLLLKLHGVTKNLILDRLELGPASTQDLCRVTGATDATVRTWLSWLSGEGMIEFRTEPTDQPSLWCLVESNEVVQLRRAIVMSLG